MFLLHYFALMIFPSKNIHHLQLDSIQIAFQPMGGEDRQRCIPSQNPHSLDCVLHRIRYWHRQSLVQIALQAPPGLHAHTADALVYEAWESAST